MSGSLTKLSLASDLIGSPVLHTPPKSREGNKKYVHQLTIIRVHGTQYRSCRCLLLISSCKFVFRKPGSFAWGIAECVWIDSSSSAGSDVQTSVSRTGLDKPTSRRYMRTKGPFTLNDDISDAENIRSYCFLAMCAIVKKPSSHWAKTTSLALVYFWSIVWIAKGLEFI